MAQLLALYIDPERHNTQRYRWTGRTDSQTARRHHEANSRLYVRSAKNY